MRRSPRGRLRFRASSAAPLPGDAPWSWQDDRSGADVPLPSVELVVDAQRRLLLRLPRSPGAPRWLWLQAANAPADWLALRRALLAAAAR